MLNTHGRKFTPLSWPQTNGGVFVAADRCDFRFSNWPFWVKHFQTIHRCSIDVARGLALLFGLGTRALP
jgi:hypothetical protein